MPRPLPGRVGGSTGAAEHHGIKHRFALVLSRTTTLKRASALACVVALALAGVPAFAVAQASNAPTSLREAIDATADQWFRAQGRSDDLDRRIEMLTKTLSAQQERVDRIRAVADKRAVQIYQDSTQGLGTMFGSDPLEVGRRAALIGQANSESQAAIDALNSSVAELTAQRADLDRAREDLAETLSDLDTQRRTLDAQLAKLQLSSPSAGDQTVLAAEVGRTRITTAAATAAGVTTATPTPTTQAPTATATPAPPSNSGRVSSHHDDPFLVCTRAHESAGDYSVVSSSGYYGAYQFAPTTWNVTASHAGRVDLVGVLPSLASPYDQDEMAWVLYQWQGNSPWGGRC